MKPGFSDICASILSFAMIVILVWEGRVLPWGPRAVQSSRGAAGARAGGEAGFDAGDMAVVRPGRSGDARSRAAGGGAGDRDGAASSEPGRRVAGGGGRAETEGNRGGGAAVGRGREHQRRRGHQDADGRVERTDRGLQALDPGRGAGRGAGDLLQLHGDHRLDAHRARLEAAERGLCAALRCGGFCGVRSVRAQAKGGGGGSLAGGCCEGGRSASER